MTDRAIRRKELMEAIRNGQKTIIEVVEKVKKGRVKLSEIGEVELKPMPFGSDLFQFQVTFTGEVGNNPTKLLWTLYDSIPWVVKFGHVNVEQKDNPKMFDVTMIW